jgi:predicted Zn-dependent protease
VELSAQTLEPDRGLELLDGALGGIAGPAELFLCARRERAVTAAPDVRALVESAGSELIATARVWREERCGVAVGGVLGLHDLHRLLWAAEANAGFGPLLALPSPAFARPAGPAPASSGGGTRLWRDALEAIAEGLAGQGRIQALLGRAEEGWVAVVSSAGVRAAQWTPGQRVMVRLEHPLGALVDGVEGGASVPLDVRALLGRLRGAVEALEGGGGPPAPGLPWLLSPQAAAPLVAGLGWLLSGDTAAAVPGIARALGKKIFPSCLTFLDGPSLPERHLDDEGQPRAEQVLIREGRLEQFAHASDSAQRLKQPLNGCAVRPGDAGFPLARLRAPTVSPSTASPSTVSPSTVSPSTVSPSTASTGTGAWPPDRNEFTARLETFVAGPRAGKVLLVLAGFVVRGGVRADRIAPFEIELPILDAFRGLLQVGADAAHFPTVDGARTPSLLIPSQPVRS